MTNSPKRYTQSARECLAAIVQTSLSSGPGEQRAAGVLALLLAAGDLCEFEELFELAFGEGC